jgi:hypothetical protein
MSQAGKPAQRELFPAGIAPSEQTLFAIWDTIDRIRDRQGEHVAHQLARRALVAIVEPAPAEHQQGGTKP